MCAKKKQQNRSGFLFMFVIAILLGLVIYAYRDKFAVLFNTHISGGKQFLDFSFAKTDEGNDEGDVTEHIRLMEEESDKRLKKKVKKDLGLFKLDFDKIKKRFSMSDVDEVRETSPKDSSKKKDNKLVVKKDTTNSKTPTKTNTKKVEKRTPVKKKTTSIKKEEAPKEKRVEKKPEIKKEGASEKNESKKETPKYKQMSRRLYFSQLVDEDNIRLVGVKRTITYTNMPLTETLKELLSGPTTLEKDSAIITNIPTSTKLISVKIKNNIAYINLSNDFEYNRYGREATIAQIQQLVYTTTEFSNIRSVQILINGQVKTYLGGEGILINKPLSRNDFT